MYGEKKQKQDSLPKQNLSDGYVHESFKKWLYQGRERQISFVNYSYNITREIHHPLAHQKKLLPRNLCAIFVHVSTHKAVCPLGFASSLYHFLILSESGQDNLPPNPCQADATISNWSTCFSPRKTGFIAESQYPVSWVMVFAPFTLLPGPSTCNCKLDF